MYYTDAELNYRNEDETSRCVALDMERLSLTHLPCGVNNFIASSFLYYLDGNNLAAHRFPNATCEFDRLAFIDAQSKYK